jgi:hypothetical protein
MKEFSRFELATIKRVAQSVSMQRRKKAKLESKIADLQNELVMVNTIIDSFEAPVIKMSGGFTSEEILNGVMEVAEATEAIPEGTIDEGATVEEVEVAAQEAVAIDPAVESPLATTAEEAEQLKAAGIPFWGAESRTVE